MGIVGDEIWEIVFLKTVFVFDFFHLIFQWTDQWNSAFRKALHAKTVKTTKHILRNNENSPIHRWHHHLFSLHFHPESMLSNHPSRVMRVFPLLVKWGQKREDILSRSGFFLSSPLILGGCFMNQGINEGTSICFLGDFEWTTLSHLLISPLSFPFTLLQPGNKR